MEGWGNIGLLLDSYPSPFGDLSLKDIIRARSELSTFILYGKIVSHACVHNHFDRLHRRSLVTKVLKG